jgi:5-methylcytosine-specific restriction endonuclease McrA
VEESLKRNGVRDSRRRQMLWAEQNGKCFYCARTCILPNDLLKEFAYQIDKENLVKFLLSNNRDTIGNLIDYLLREVPEFKYRWHDDLATLEHVVPRGTGGEDKMENLVMACARCNQERGARTSREKEYQIALTNPRARRFRKKGWVWDPLQNMWVDPNV